MDYQFGFNHNINSLDYHGLVTMLTTNITPTDRAQVLDQLVKMKINY